MKKYNLILILLLIVSLLSISCSSEVDFHESSSSYSSIFKSELDAKNHVFVSATAVENIYSTRGSVQIDFTEPYEFFDVDGSIFPETSFQDNSIYVTENLNDSLQHIFKLGEPKQIIHKNTDAEIYVPNFVKLNSNLIEVGEFFEISKSRGAELEWEQDFANSNSYLFLVIIDRGEINSVPTNAVISKTLEDSSGRVDISPSELNDFSNDGKVDIYLARGNEQMIEDTAFTFYNVNVISAKMID